MWRIAPFVLAALAVLPEGACAREVEAAARKADGELLAVGQRIYREGILPSGQPLEGVAQAGVRRAGRDAACETCHRRSGQGSSEGSLEIRSISGPSLFGKPGAPPVASSGVSPGAGLAPAAAARAAAVILRNARIAALSGAPPRPPYDDASLFRAITDGIDVTGRRMNPGMPRYALDEEALRALAAYLKTLSVEPSPGVAEDSIHFATVIQPGTDAAQRSAMLEVLRAFIQDRNAGMRADVRRERAGSVHLGRTYREWVLHVWELSGASDTWQRQLEAHDSRQPAFALISGLGNANWRPIHEFSERRRVPCIFPQVDVPVVADPGYYTVYLSKGMVLEAQALAKYLQDQGERGPLTQVFRRDDDASAAAADAFRKAWEAGTGIPPSERVLDATPGSEFWGTMAGEAPNATLILWLPPRDLEQARALTGAGSPVKVVYLSSSLHSGRRTGLAADGGGRVRFVYAQDVPATREARLKTVKAWLRSRGIEPSDEKVQMNAYLAMVVIGGVLSHNLDSFSRDFLLERVEHVVGNNFAASLYPSLSLGPGQRFASKGSYIVEVGGAQDGQLKPVSDWIVP